MSPSAVPAASTSFAGVMAGEHEGDSAPYDDPGNCNPTKRKKKNRGRGGKKFKNARAAGLEEENTLINAPIDKEDALDTQCMSGHGELLNTATGISKQLAVQPVTSSDMHESATEHTDAAESICADGEGNAIDQEGNSQTTNKKTSGSKFDKTANAWSETLIDGEMWQSTHTNGTHDLSSPPITPKQRISDWFHAQNKHPYHNLGRLLRERAIEHVHNFKHPDATPADWNRQVRLMIWRAVVRANFFWKNPYTGEDESKPEPIVRPAGVFENSFEAFVECAAERLDRVGRDLPDPDYVKRVELDVREFLARVERAGKGRELEHFAFLLLFDEEQRKSALGLLDLQERIRRSIAGNSIDWKGLEFMKRARPANKPFASTSTVVMGDAVWKDVGSRL